MAITRAPLLRVLRNVAWSGQQDPSDQARDHLKTFRPQSSKNGDPASALAAWPAQTADEEQIQARRLN